MCRKGAAKSSKKRAPPPQRGRKEKRGERRGRISAPGAPPFLRPDAPSGHPSSGKPRSACFAPAAHPAPPPHRRRPRPRHIGRGRQGRGKREIPPFPFSPPSPAAARGTAPARQAPSALSPGRQRAGRNPCRTCPFPQRRTAHPFPQRRTCRPFFPRRTCPFPPAPHRAPFSPAPHLPFSPSAAPRTLFPPCGTCREGPGAGGAGPARPHTPKPPACRAGAPAGLPPKKCGEAPLRARGGEPLFVAVCIGYSFFASARPSSSSSRKKRAMWKPSAAAWCSSSATGISTLSPRLTQRPQVMMGGR